MNPKINTEYEKNAAKITELQARQEELAKQRTELENLDIIGLVRSMGLTPDQLEALIQSSKPAATGAGNSVKAPLPGVVLSIPVKVGQAVKAADTVLLLEAMKMENEIMAPCDGTIASVSVTKGASVESGSLLCVIG